MNKMKTSIYNSLKEFLPVVELELVISE